MVDSNSFCSDDEKVPCSEGLTASRNDFDPVESITNYCEMETGIIWSWKAMKVMNTKSRFILG
jgi:hypothetical protein